MLKGQIWFLTLNRNFTQFYATKSERERNQKKEYEAQMLYRQSLQQFIDRWRYNANRGRTFLLCYCTLWPVIAAQAQARIKILEKLPDLEPPEEEDTESFKSVFFYVLGISADLWQVPWCRKDFSSVTTALWSKFRLYARKADSQERLYRRWVRLAYRCSRSQRCRKIYIDKAAYWRVRSTRRTCKSQWSLENVSRRTSTLVRSYWNCTQCLFRTTPCWFAHSYGVTGHFPCIKVPWQKRAGIQVPSWRLWNNWVNRVKHSTSPKPAKICLQKILSLQLIGTLSGGQKSRVAFAALSLQRPHILLLDEVSLSTFKMRVLTLPIAFQSFG